MGFRPGVGSLSVLLCVGGVCAPAAASPSRHVVMAWTRTEPTCIAEPDLVSMVERTLARPVFHSAEPPLAKVSGSVGPVGGGLIEAHIVLAGMDGRVLAERKLTTSGDCRGLDESVALVVTLMIDGLEDTPTPLQVAAAPLREAPALGSSPLVGPETEPPAQGPRPAPLALAFGLGAGVSSSLLPGVVPSFGARGEVGLGRFVSLALTLRVHAPSSKVVAGQGGSFNAWTGELGGCSAWSSGRLRLGGCLGVGGGTIAGDEVNLIDGASHVRPLVLATLLPFVAARLVGPVWVRAEGGAWFPLLRERWGYLDNGGAFRAVFQPAAVVPVAALTLELRTGS